MEIKWATRGSRRVQEQQGTSSAADKAAAKEPRIVNAPDLDEELPGCHAGTICRSTQHIRNSACLWPVTESCFSDLNSVIDNMYRYERHNRTVDQSIPTEATTLYP